MPSCRELAENGARKQHASLLPRIAIDLFTTLRQTPAAPIRQFNAPNLSSRGRKGFAFHRGTNKLAAYYVAGQADKESQHLHSHMAGQRWSSHPLSGVYRHTADLDQSQCMLNCDGGLKDIGVIIK